MGADNELHDLKVERSVLRGDDSRYGLPMGEGGRVIERCVMAELARIGLLRDHPWNRTTVEPLVAPELPPLANEPSGESAGGDDLPPAA